jgi:hypothetical protein
LASSSVATSPQVEATLWQQLLALLTHPALVLGSWFLLVFAGWLSFMLQTPADQGRLLFPALLPLSLAVVAGLGRWPRPWSQTVAATLALLTAIACLLLVIRPTYAPPPVITALPADATALGLQIAPGIELAGARVETAAVQPDEWAWVTLYWRATATPLPHSLSPAGEAPVVQLNLFGRGYHLAGRQVAYHGRGLYPRPLWPEGMLLAEQTAVRLYPWAETPNRGRLSVLLVTAEGLPWPGAGEEGTAIGETKIAAPAWPAHEQPLARLGEGIELAQATLRPEQAQPGDEVVVRVRWQVSAAPGNYYHTFVHLGDSTQPPLAQYDSPPLADEYPTSLWEAGEVIDEEMRLQLPPDLPTGRYPISIGLYTPASGTRLPLFVGGEQQAHDVFVVGWVTVRS